MTNEELLAKVQALAVAANRLSHDITQLLVSVETNKASVADKAAKAEPPKMEDVRAVLTKLSSDKGAVAVKTLLKDFGATKLSDIAAQDYAELLAKAEEMGR